MNQAIADLKSGFVGASGVERIAIAREIIAERDVVIFPQYTDEERAKFLEQNKEKTRKAEIDRIDDEQEAESVYPSELHLQSETDINELFDSLEHSLSVPDRKISAETKKQIALEKSLNTPLTENQLTSLGEVGLTPNSVEIVRRHYEDDKLRGSALLKRIELGFGYTRTRQIMKIVGG